MEKMDTHSVQFYGFYHSFQDGPFAYAEYEEIENKASRLDREAGYYIKFVNGIDKSNLNILDFGGGLGGHYLTLKEHTTKNFNYHIVERPESFAEINKEVTYYPNVQLAVADFSDEIDCLYSNATIFMTKNKSAVEHIHDFCKVSPNHIFLQRSIVCEGENYEHFYTYPSTDFREGVYFSIISEKNMIDICESYGYDLVYVEPIYTKFIINNAPSDLGTICYKDYLFKKRLEK